MTQDFFFPRIATPFDTSNKHYGESVRQILKKFLPISVQYADLQDPLKKELILKNFHTKLPVVVASKVNAAPCQLSFYVCCLQRPNAYRFFYEMISHWLIPGKRLNALVQFAIDFFIPDLSNHIYMGGEIILQIENQHELLLIQKNLPYLESEIRRGLESFYQASRILEIKGLAIESKIALIQENIAALIKHRPQDFDYDIFSEMQHFFAICKDDFKTNHQYRDISRIICVHYLFRKALKLSLETFPERRYISVKTLRISLKESGQTRMVLGVIVGMSFIKENESFEEKHLINAIKILIPKILAVRGSFLVNAKRSEQVQLFYLEIEKESRESFSIEETKLLRENLPNELKHHIERRLNPIFMPQNEEEIMRDILTLSNELRYVRDLPQVMISFEKQSDKYLEFMVVLVRIVKDLDENFEHKILNRLNLMEFVLDRTKNVGYLRKKYRKEARVLKVKIEKHTFLRKDHSVDLFKARQAISKEFCSIIGEFRDYNGGMISKEAEAFLSLRKILGKTAKEQEFLLENFYYSFHPAIMRSVLEPDPLKYLFSMLLEIDRDSIESCNSYLYRIKKEKEYLYVLIAAEDIAFIENLILSLERFEVSAFQIAWSSIYYHGLPCLGIIFRPSDIHDQQRFIQALEHMIDLSCNLHPLNTTSYSSHT